ncbi:helix-turn-helix transcriptional regulator [Micromonospora sp. KC723]|uniref:ArsR/SmtB family transcription factor n=1 Tax=Micromonospora sp. KC723 TaxID=2530381 RepID=UPI001044CB8D|nr:metalloregulator ArsR/SmtB family transcription factor [Micromonospora sp. KC723]TDB75459.1 transcriptional regulator [Micromonospora sp. KC723]
MSNQPAPPSVLDLNTDTPCCPPLTRRRVSAETAAILAPALKALGDPVRLQLMSMIASAEGGEACVCDLTPAFDLTGPTISHHLRTLREAGLVDAERRGTWVYYRARPGTLRHLAALLAVESGGGAWRDDQRPVRSPHPPRPAPRPLRG